MIKTKPTKIKKLVLLSCVILLINTYLATAQRNSYITFDVRGLAIAAPSHDGVDAFISFVDKELAPNSINTLILRVDYNYQYQTHPELRNENALSKEDVKKIVEKCQEHKIRIIPQINLLGHQSWESTVENLLKVYPQFDETPHVKLPAKYAWPNADGLYCKSYCPLHPDLHSVVFDLVDEICDVFEADAFHAGMDEVFYIGDDKCPRCKGKDKSELFANEVNLVNAHLAEKKRELWIWGDRLIDGHTTGLGMWEASENDTHRAIDMVNKAVVICDWHYERPDLTAVIFASKGFRVITCPWNKPDIAMAQIRNTQIFKVCSTSEVSDRYLGIMQTIWSDCERFIQEYNKAEKSDDGSVKCFRALLHEFPKSK